ncbi:GlxA family transcriptional regulator [Burkholderia cenocepacia]|uniref:GlxA family transcriptional regulator n=1 Tax=Burkholderia cenocepacia TaxID=95486 RepID=UPI0009E108D0|nr:GlxA family transcriptional regulator [Burkholderia cenocepacia]ARF86779.1 amidase domain/AraC-type DNA-binding HTH domain-containing transcriptional regulator [Burkholderia cenocepacia]MCW3674613.1 GlxA family transcriptional regulator [Burkholderia cenocepacia]MDC6082487.1 GlxA family transcriptional regulator [Burkholderia cenocepacia]
MIRVAVVLYPGFSFVNLGIVSVFEFANLSAGERLYEVQLLSEAGGLVTSSAGVEVNTTSFDERVFDTVIVVGDNDATVPAPGLTAFLKQAAMHSRRICATCTGAFHLANAGLVHGKRVTTHWFHAPRLRKNYPTVHVEADSIFVNDGPIWTSAGATASIDLALAFVEQDGGAELARLVAKKLVVYHRRAGGQTQHSVLLDILPRSDRIQKALSYARQHLQSELSVEELANAANLSPRQFSRAFHEETGHTPAKAVEQLRTEAARLMLESGRHAIETIAREVGFGDPDRMRRAFLRSYGQPPQVIRRATRGGAQVDAA